MGLWHGGDPSSAKPRSGNAWEAEQDQLWVKASHCLEMSRCPLSEQRVSGMERRMPLHASTNPMQLQGGLGPLGAHGTEHVNP